MKHEIHEVNGYLFQIGKGDAYAPVFAIKIGNRFHGVWTVRNVGDELGFNSGIYATEEMIKAIEKASEILEDIRKR